MAIQFTVFPNSGISIGLTLNHLAADATSFYHFIKRWTSIHRSQGGGFSLPYCSKDVIQDPNDISSVYLKDIRSWDVLGPVGDVDAGNLNLITSVIKRAKIEQLKHLVTTQSKIDGELEGIRISTFAATCAFMWVNLMRLQEQIRGGLGDDDNYYFVIAADCRQQLALPIPGTYFGNCLAQILVSAKRGDLMGETGVAVAAKAIARKTFEFSRGALVGAEKWVSKTRDILKHGRLVSVAGSPKFKVYDTDFGWGKPKKYEYVHIGAYGSFSLVESREEQGGVEVGVVVGRDKLGIFNDILKEIRPSQCRL